MVHGCTPPISALVTPFTLIQGSEDLLDMPALAIPAGFLGRDDRATLIHWLGDNIDPETVIELDPAVLENLLADTAPARIAAWLDDLDTDEAISLLEQLDEERLDEVLHAVPAPERARIQEGLAFPEETAARMMQRDFVAVPAYWTVGQVIDYCRDSVELPDEFYEIFVVDPRHRPIGSVPLYRAMRSKRPVMVRTIMAPETRLVPLEMDQEAVAFLFRQYRMASAPVIDDGGRMVGVVTFDDVAEVIEEEADEDILRLAGVAGESDLTQSVGRTTRTRFTWLLVNLFTAILASAVIGMFDATIQQIVALAVLMPIVASMGGNAGTQTLTVAVRALATRDLTAANALRIVAKEVVVGGINGLLFAVLIGLVAWFWFGLPALGLVIAAAMVINLLVAGLFGTLIPLGCHRLGVDPAVAASVFLTTVTDVIGFLTFLGLAAWFLI